MSLCDRRSTSNDLAIPGLTFSWQAQYFRQMEWKNAKLIGTRPSAPHPTFIVEGSLAELLCFRCCQVQKLKKSRGIASFWMLSSSKLEEVSRHCFVLDVVKFKN